MMMTARGRTVSVGDELAEDHKEIGLVVDRLRSLLAAPSGDPRPVLSTLERFLVRHMDWEERRLFPSVREAVPGDRRRHLEALEADHGVIRGLLGELGREVGRGDRPAARAAAARLAERLSGHEEDEEEGVYRDADLHLSDGERRRLIAALRKGPTPPP